MEELMLHAQVRREIGKNKAQDLRDAGFIPAVIYSKEEGSLPLKVSHHELIQLVHQHRIEGVVLKLVITDGKKEKIAPCVIKEIQYHPVHENIEHVDFNQISLTEQIEVKVPVVIEGEPVGVKQDGGSLEHLLWEIEVKCLPANIPGEFRLDVSGLKMGDAIHVQDISLPLDVHLVSDPEAVVVHVVAPMQEEEAAAEEGLEGETSQEPEVIREKKPEAEAEGGSEETKEAE